MKVQSSKSDIRDMTTVDSSSSSQAAPSDLFSNLIMDAATVTQSSDAASPEIKKEKDVDQQSSQPDPTAVNPMIAALNLINQMNQSEVPNQEKNSDLSKENIESDAISAVLQQSSEKKSVDATINKTIKNDQNITKTTSAFDQAVLDQAAIDKDQIESIETDIDPNQIAINQAATTDQTDKADELKQSTQIPYAMTQAMDMSDKSVDLSAQLAEKLSNQKVDIKGDKTSQQQKITDINPAQTSVEKVQEQLDNSVASIFTTLKEPIAAQDGPQNKYVDAFTQLGNFINGHTMNHHFSNDATTMPGSLGIGQSEFANTLKQAHKDQDISVELMSPLSTDALNKQSYDAKIKIYPPELGHVMAKLKMDKNNAELHITTESSRVKEIVEANLPQLREHFKQADINLITVQVDATPTSTKEQSSNQRNSEQFQHREYMSEQDKSVLSPKESAGTLNTLVDTYA